LSQFSHQLRTAPRWRQVLVYVVGALALAPLVFMVPELATADFYRIGISTAAVLGVGGVVIFIAMMMITPLVNVTGWRWVAPLRQWFGIVFAATVGVDIILTAITASVHLGGGFLSRTVGHPFTLVGVVATLLTVAIALTASRRGQVSLGRHWRTVQRFTYVVWALILLHLALLMGFGTSENGILFFGDAQRFYQVLFMSVPLVLFRIPAVRAWCVRARGSWQLWAVGLLALGVVVFFWGGLISYEIEQGTQAFTLTPRDE
jgi:DMSO/TMAO reductase YedYZ heme-binding membrane subunit